MFPEHRVTVALTSNVAHADTFPLGARVAEAFVGRVDDRFDDGHLVVTLLVPGASEL
jgi:hypothetical protein